MAKSNKKSRWRIIYLAVYSTMAVLALLCILAIVLDTGEALKLIAQNTLGAIIGAGIIDIFVEFVTKNQKEEDISERIMNSLCPKEDLQGEMPLLGKLYNRESVSQFMKNSIMAYTGSGLMSKAYASYIDHSFNSVKKDDIYIVTVSENDGLFHLCQDLKATYIFEDKDAVDIKAFFVLQDPDCKKKESRLDAILSDDSYLFREEICNTDFIRESILPNIGSKAGLVESLDFKLSVFDSQGKEHTVPTDAIEVQPLFEGSTCLGFALVYHFYDKHNRATSSNRTRFIRSQDVYNSNAGHVCFTAKFHVKYPIPDSQNHFHLVYARPTVAPSFALVFENINGYSSDKVDFLPFLSFDTTSICDRDKDGKVQVHASSFEFSSSRIILPRSGIAFSWNFRKELPRLEQQFMDYGLVNIALINPDIDVMLMYGTEDNFLQRNLYNNMKSAYFVPEIAVMLSEVQKTLDTKKPGWRLRILDAARPKSIQASMYEYALNNGKQKYVADPAKGGFHNYGLAVDLTILNENDKPLDMGCAFDTFSELAHFGDEDALVGNGSISREAAGNRRFLHDLMLEHGFTHNPDEWWHFQKYTIPQAKKQFRLLDF